MDTRLFPLSEAYFMQTIDPLIGKHYKRPGRPPKESRYHFFCDVLYVLRTAVSWRDLPANFGCWHTVYTRFKR